MLPQLRHIPPLTPQQPATAQHRPAVVPLAGGVIVVEWVFAFPGIGQGLVQATSTSDAFNVEAMPASGESVRFTTGW